MSVNAALLVLIFALFHPNLAYPICNITSYGINVSIVNGTLTCDQIECPNETTFCRVIKESSNISKVRINNTCYDGSKILKEKSWTKENKGKALFRITVEMTSSCIASSSYQMGVNGSIGDSIGSLLGDFFGIFG